MAATAIDRPLRTSERTDARAVLEEQFDYLMDNAATEQVRYLSLELVLLKPFLCQSKPVDPWILD